MRSITLVSLLLAAACSFVPPYQPPDVVRKLLEQAPMPGTHLGVAYADRDGRLVWGVQPDRLFVPASNLKLVTSALALKVLGPDHQFVTGLSLNGTLKDGVLNGDLVLVAGADPLLTSMDLANLAKRAAAGGLKRVTGRLLVDASILDEVPFGPGWMWDDSEDPPICGLMIDGNQDAFPDPVLAGGQRMVALLKQAGIQVAKGAGRSDGAKGPLWVTHASVPLKDVIVPFNKESVNQIGEMLFKAAGARVYGAPGSWEKGAKAAEQFLTEVGLESGSFRVVDGSGLSRYNLMTPRQLTQLLAYQSRMPWMGAYQASLPVAGKDGTLKSRMIGSRAEGRFMAKTGTMSGVSALSGYVTDGKERKAIVSILMNGFVGSAAPARLLQDQLVDRLFQL